MTTIKVGDNVRVVDGAYNFTRDGSEGIVISSHNDFVKVKFYKITGHYYEEITEENTKTWEILTCHLEVIDSVPAGPYNKIISKILKLQHKRKELGYAF